METSANASDQEAAANQSVRLYPSDGFWTDQQLAVLATIPRRTQLAMGVYLIAISVFGVAANAVVLYVFSRFKRLRTPANVFVTNLAVSDMCGCLLHPMAAYSALANGRWSFGKTGCNAYGAGIGFFGLNTICTLAAIACERYTVLTCRPTVSNRRINCDQVKKICLAIWIYNAVLTLPPWLFGWSKYEPEGFLVTCSWDYTTRTLSNRLYYVYLLVFGFVVPVAVLVYCYGRILDYVLRHGREVHNLGRTSSTKKRIKSEIRMAVIIFMLSLMYFVAWGPYTVLSLMVQFGPQLDEPLTPMATSLPAFFAKTAVFFDPLVYGFSHPQFRTCLRHLMHAYRLTSTSNQMSRPDTTMLTVRPDRTSMRTASPFRYQRKASQLHPPRRPCSSNQQSSSTIPHIKLTRPQTICILHQNRVVRSESFDSTASRSSRRRDGKRAANGAPSAAVDGGNNVVVREGRPRSSVAPFREANEHRMLLVSKRQNSRTGRRLKTKRRKYHVSEPELSRCWTDRVIPNAAYLTWTEYRRKKRLYTRAIFFRSAENLRHYDFQHLMAREKKHSVVTFTGNGSSLSVRDDSRRSSGSCPSSASRMSRRTTEEHQIVHRNCCECAYIGLSQTVTFAAIPSGSGRKEWRACMVNGRHSISNSVNSP